MEGVDALNRRASRIGMCSTVQHYGGGLLYRVVLMFDTVQYSTQYAFVPWSCSTFAPSTDGIRCSAVHCTTVQEVVVKLKGSLECVTSFPSERVRFGASRMISGIVVICCSFFAGTTHSPSKRRDE